MNLNIVSFTMAANNHWYGLENNNNYYYIIDNPDMFG